jgi:hypothetical protein
MELHNQLLNHILLFHETLENGFSGDNTSNDVQVYIPMEYDRRVIIKLLFNERCDATQIVERLKAQFHEGAYLLRSVQFWIGQIKRR